MFINIILFSTGGGKRKIPYVAVHLSHEYKTHFQAFPLPKSEFLSVKYAHELKENEEIISVNEVQMFARQSNLSECVNGSTAPVSMEFLKRVANTHAIDIWGDKMKRGEPLLILDATCKKILYAFPFIRSQQQKSPDKVNLKKYGTIYVSTSKERVPLSLKRKSYRRPHYLP